MRPDYFTKLFCLVCLIAKCVILPTPLQGSSLAGDSPVDAKAKLVMPTVFSDHMVLQQGKSVAVWGTAPAESKITVEFAGQIKTGITDSFGKWEINLDPMLASFEPRVMTVSSTLNDEPQVLNFADVLVGEVWLCSGQSNMAWSLQRTSHATGSAQLFEGLDAIRFFNAPTPRTHLETNGWDGWRVANSQTVMPFSAVASLFGLNLSNDLRLPVGIISCAYGGVSMESWISKEALTIEPAAVNILRADAFLEQVYSGAELAAAEADFVQFQKTRTGSEPFGPWNQRRPGLMFENGLKPLIPYAVAGFLYYQGEAQAGRGAQVRKLLPLLIQDWRARWSDPHLPFIVVQLPAFGDHGKSNEVTWVEVRESQRATVAEDPYSALVVLIDSGDEADVHPLYKIHVGERAAKAALALAYGKRVPFSGPIYKNKITNPDGSVILGFDVGADRLIAQNGRLETGLYPVADGTVLGFTACGGDGVFVPATATLIGVDRVQIRHDDGRPVGHVRYAWKNWPEVGLYNDAGLPASPFRTDSLPLESNSRLQDVWPGFNRFLR
jgi:sialate O-acetylesterase